MTNIKRFFKDESGATAIEYGLLAGLISIVAITTMGSVGTGVDAKLGLAATALGQ